MNNNEIRIAQIIGKWVGGGVEATIMNYYRNINRSKVQFDFICDNDSTNIPYKEIEKLGGKVFLVPPYQKIFKYHKELKKVLVGGNYKIVHSHINTLSIFSLFAAKKAGIPIRIAHSHSTTNKKEIKRNIIKQCLRPFSKVCANVYFACSENAGKWLFGKKCFNNGKVEVINNAIDIQQYLFKEETREKVRKELKIEDNTLVLGNVGRLVETKNHIFLLDVFENLLKIYPNSKLIIVGEGKLKDKLEGIAENKKIRDKVMFLGQRGDVQELYQAMDVFALPSLYEGFGMVLLEAQASGLPCIASFYVPEAAKLISEFKFLNIHNARDSIVWSEEILKLFSNTKNRKSDCNLMKNRGYDIKTEAIKLEKIYTRLIEDKKV